MSASSRPGRKAYLLISLFALLLVLFPFLFWYNTWFGRPLTDAALDGYFADTAKPRHAQQALVQVEERLRRNQPAARWYPNVIQQAASPNIEVRQTAAWVMQFDPKSAAFHEALLRLIEDPVEMVRRNAALSLAAFGDSAGRTQLDAMLRSFTITAPAAGTIRYRLKLGDYVNPGTLIARIGDTEVRSAAPGEVRALALKDGVVVKAGDALADLGAAEPHVWEALRALYLVGQPADLEDVEHYLRPGRGMTERVARQASLTAEAIRARQREAAPPDVH